jgi:hypothetical protein
MGGHGSHRLELPASVGKLRLVPAATKEGGLQVISYGCFRLIDATEVEF